MRKVQCWFVRDRGRRFSLQYHKNKLVILKEEPCHPERSLLRSAKRSRRICISGILVDANDFGPCHEPFRPRALNESYVNGSRCPPYPAARCAAPGCESRRPAVAAVLRRRRNGCA